MKIIKINIKNFRSIRNISINFEEEHKIQYIVGENESGKTNILNAIKSINSFPLDSFFKKNNKNFYLKEQKTEILYSFFIDNSFLEDFFSFFEINFSNLKKINFFCCLNDLNPKKYLNIWIKDETINGQLLNWILTFFNELLQFFFWPLQNFSSSNEKKFPNIFLIKREMRKIKIMVYEIFCESFGLKKDTFFSHSITDENGEYLNSLLKEHLLGKNGLNLNVLEIFLSKFCLKYLNWLFNIEGSGGTSPFSKFSREIDSIINNSYHGINISSRHPWIWKYSNANEMNKKFWTLHLKLKKHLEIYQNLDFFKGNLSILSFDDDTFLQKNQNKFQDKYQLSNIEKYDSSSDNETSVFFKGLWTLWGLEKKILNNLIDLNSSNKKDEIQDFYKKEIQKKLENISNSSFSWQLKKFRFEIVFSHFDDPYFKIRIADVFDFKNEKNINKKNLDLGKFRSSEHRSLGWVSHLYLMIYLEYFKEICTLHNKKSFLLVLDEPGLHLHAEGIAILRKNLENLVKNTSNLYILIATHNPFFITEENFPQLNLVSKTLKEDGTIIVNKAVNASNKEKCSGITPFLFQIGLYMKDFQTLSNSQIVFLEGPIDVFILEGMQKYFQNSSYDKFKFISLGGASKINPNNVLINLLLSISGKPLYFIFDYDDAGNKGLEKIKKSNFYCPELENAFFINGQDKKTKNNNKKYETQNLFENTLFNKGEKIIEMEKNQHNYYKLKIALSQKNIEISKQAKDNFKKIFDKLIIKN